MERRRFLAAAGAACLAGCLGEGQTAAPPGEGDWPVFGADDANTGHNPHASGPAGSSGLDWRTSVGRRTGSPGPPVVVGDTIYVGAILEGGGVVALDANTGEKRWRFDGGEVWGTPAIAGRTVYAVDRGGSCHALDAANGAKRWRFDTGYRAMGSGPAVANGTVYFRVGEAHRGGGALTETTPPEGRTTATTRERPPGGMVLALDADTGEKRWRAADPFPADGVDAPLALADGGVYLSAQAGLVVLDAATGGVRWSYRLERREATPRAPVVGEDRVYLVTEGAPAVVAVERRTAERGWLVSLPEDERTAAPVALADGTLYVVSARPTERLAADSGDNREPASLLRAIDAATGRVEWTHATEPGSVDVAPAVAAGTVYVGFGGRLAAVDAATGEPAWCLDLCGEGGLGRGPAVVGDRVYATCRHGTVIAVG